MIFLNFSYSKVPGSSALPQLIDDHIFQIFHGLTLRCFNIALSNVKCINCVD